MDQRPLTPGERQTLTRVPAPTAPFPLAWDIGMGSFGATGCLGAMLILAVAAFFGTYNADRRTTTTAILIVAGLAVLSGAVSTRLRYSAERRRQLARQATIDDDLAGGVASIQRHQATAAIRAILEEYRLRAYFMRLADGRVMFIGHWRSPEDENPAIQDLPEDLPAYPSSEFEIARGPSSGILLGVTFTGTPLTVETTFEHRPGLQAPSLGVGEVAPVAWDQVRKTYG